MEACDTQKGFNIFVNSDIWDLVKPEQVYIIAKMYIAKSASLWECSLWPHRLLHIQLEMSVGWGGAAKGRISALKEVPKGALDEKLPLQC